MIEVNKEMTWEEAYKTYPYKKAMVKVLERGDGVNGTRPRRLIVIKVIENRDDLEVIDREIYDSNYEYDTVVFPNSNGVKDKGYIGGFIFK